MQCAKYGKTPWLDYRCKVRLLGYHCYTITASTFKGHFLGTFTVCVYLLWLYVCCRGVCFHVAYVYCMYWGCARWRGGTHLRTTSTASRNSHWTHVTSKVHTRASRYVWRSTNEVSVLSHTLVCLVLLPIFQLPPRLAGCHRDFFPSTCSEEPLLVTDAGF